MNREFKNRLLSLVLSLNFLLLPGCAKKVDCEIKNKHVHEYISEEGIKRYLESEREYVGLLDNYKYYRTNNYLLLNEENIEKLELISNKGLVDINENIEAIRDIYSSLSDHIIYQYRYSSLVKSGKGYITVTHYAWTDDPHHSGLTGKKDIVTHVFYGYNIEKNEKGKYVTIKSGPVRDVNILIDMGYKYINSNISEEMHLSDYLYKIGINDFNIEDYVNELENNKKLSLR